MSTSGSEGQSSFAVGESPPEPESGVSIDEISEPKLHAHVRYSYIDENGEFKQELTLRSVAQPIPRSANYVSTGVYLLTADQENRLHRGAHPKEIQNQCEREGRVLYSVVVETDGLEPSKGKSASECIEAVETFAQDWIGVEDHRLYFSGNRSIHLETDRYVTHEGLERLKELAEEFNREYEVTLDTTIYDPKSQFRIGGVKHQDTDLYKREISREADRSDLVRKVNQDDPVGKETFHHLPTPEGYSEDTLLREEYYSNTISPSSYYSPGDNDRESIPSEFEGELIEGYLKENEEETEDHEQYHRDIDRKHHFSPYAKTGIEKGRSVTVAKQIDGLLCRRGERDKVYLPAWIEYAVGGGDGSYTRYNSDSLIRLSKKDYAKWDYEPGDWVVIIGGRSGSSRILSVHESDAMFVGMALRQEGREKALEVLSNRGYDVGERGNHGELSSEEGGSRESEAAKIKRRIDRGEPEPKNYDNISKVACRLLRLHGWDAAWEWVERTFGPQFDPEDTYEHLKTFAEYYDELDHVDVPESVEEAKR